MIFDESINDLEQTVRAAWVQYGGCASGVIEVLPPGVIWRFATIEECDVQKILVIGSGDWEKTFGTYVLSKIAQQNFAGPDDKEKHKSRIREIGKKYANGETLGPIILVCISQDGPFVIIDGNHRAVAAFQQMDLVGQRVYVGVMPPNGAQYIWYQQSVVNYG